MVTRRVSEGLLGVAKQFDCIVCGELCVDVPVRPIPQDKPLGELNLMPVEPILPGVGGIVSNSGMALAKLGMRTAAFAYVGEDPWATLVDELYQSVGVNTEYLFRHAEFPTSATAVLIGEDGEHAFAHYSGASRQMDAKTMLDHLDLFAQSEFMLVGYYALKHKVENDLPTVLAEIRQTGCRTAMDTAWGGGTMDPLQYILPNLDIYIPSYDEALSQTGKTDPQDMLREYRRFTSHSLLGVKLGDRGALLSDAEESWIEIAPVSPPGEVVDTTGAGDSFYAGFIAGLVHGLSIADAGRVGAAAGACSVTAIGGPTNIRNYDETLALANG